MKDVERWVAIRGQAWLLMGLTFTWGMKFHNPHWLMQGEVID
jgi:hypothetical protein